MTFIALDARLPPTATLCMPGFPPRHVRVAERRVLLTYLLTHADYSQPKRSPHGPGNLLLAWTTLGLALLIVLCLGGLIRPGLGLEFRLGTVLAMHEHRVGRECANARLVPLVETILHEVGVQEAVSVRLPYMEVAWLVQEQVRRDVMRLAGVLVRHTMHQRNEARLAEPVEAGRVHVVVVCTHHGMCQPRLLRGALAPVATWRCCLLGHAREPQRPNGYHVSLHPKHRVVLGMQRLVEKETVEEVVRAGVVPAAYVVLLGARQVGMAYVDAPKSARGAPEEGRRLHPRKPRELWVRRPIGGIEHQVRAKRRREGAAAARAAAARVAVSSARLEAAAVTPTAEVGHEPRSEEAL